MNPGSVTTKKVRIFPIFVRTFFSKVTRKTLFQYLHTVMKDFFGFSFLLS